MSSSAEDERNDEKAGDKPSDPERAQSSADSSQESASKSSAESGSEGERAERDPKVAEIEDDPSLNPENEMLRDIRGG